MMALRRLLNLLPGRRRTIEAEVREELESLREIARREEGGNLGNLTLAAEDARAEWSWPGLERIATDLRMGLRSLNRSRGYTAVCVAVLALGTGANTAIFSVVNAVILRPLPYPNADRLVFLWEKIPSLPEPIGPRMQAQRVGYLEWRRQSDVFSDMAAYQEAPLNEAGVERPRTLSAGYASTNLFSLLGGQAVVGRLFRPDEEQNGSDRVVVLSDAYFNNRFHRDPSVMGTSITLGHADYTVIGVLPRRFHVPATYEGEDQKKPDLWLPLSRLWNRPADDTSFQLYVIALLRPGVLLDQARAAMAAVQARLNKSDAERYPVSQASVFPISVEETSRDLNLSLYVLLGAVGLLLLIGCSNLANLTIARATRRSREISIRRALGASRSRIIGHLLTESLLLSLGGAGAGLLLSKLTMESSLRFHVPIPRPEDIELNWPVFAFATAVSLLTTVLFGLAPAIAGSNVRVNEALKVRAGGGASMAVARGRQALTAAQVTLAVMLLCGSGLLIRSFVKLVQTGLGFKTEQLSVTNIDLPELRYPNGPSRAHFYETLLARAKAIPGAVTAGISSTLPMKGVQFQTFAIVGHPKPALNEAPSADVAHVSNDYFQLMALRILAGRDFTAADVERNTRGKGEGVVIVNQAFSSKFFADRNALGQRLLLEDDRPFEIIGVAQDFLAMGATSSARPQFFEAGMDASKALLLLRTRVPPESLHDEIRSLLLSLDGELPVAEISDMDHVVREALADPRAIVMLLGTFAALALLLAMIGVYSVLSHLVASRTREIGIRIALGATPGDVGRMVATQSLKPLLAGLSLGVAGGLALSRVLTSLLVGVSPNDPVTFGLAIATVVFIAPLAIWGPARRATRVDCTVALREE